jgi:hypothetical protein
LEIHQQVLLAVVVTKVQLVQPAQPVLPVVVVTKVRWGLPQQDLAVTKGQEELKVLWVELPVLAQLVQSGQLVTKVLKVVKDLRVLHRKVGLELKVLKELFRVLVR